MEELQPFMVKILNITLCFAIGEMLIFLYLKFNDYLFRRKLYYLHKIDNGLVIQSKYYIKSSITINKSDIKKIVIHLFQGKLGYFEVAAKIDIEVRFSSMDQYKRLVQFAH